MDERSRSSCSFDTRTTSSSCSSQKTPNNNKYNKYNNKYNKYNKYNSNRDNIKSYKVTRKYKRFSSPYESKRKIVNSYHLTYNADKFVDFDHYGNRLTVNKANFSSTTKTDRSILIKEANSSSTTKTDRSILIKGENENDRYTDISRRCRTISRYRDFTDLPLEWWERDEDCKQAKISHMNSLDELCDSREYLILHTTLWKKSTVLEPNMFPYRTPQGIEHYTLWSCYDLSHEEIQTFVDDWLFHHFPRVRRWQYDDNCGDRSIDLFHVHVFIEMDPFSFHISNPDETEYLPPHLMKSLANREIFHVDRHDDS